jgi:hypothetical protein
MADFKTHITTSTILGACYGGFSYWIADVPLEHCLIASGLCSVAGMLPDLDSDSGIPVRETLSFVAVMIPLLLIRRFYAIGLSAETIILIVGGIYLALRFGVGEIFKRYTVHRGMWHSVPAAAIAGMATFLVCFSPELGIRLFKAWAVVIGFLSHLMLDELYSVDLSGKTIRIKKSFGTAMKFWRRHWWANISTYWKIVLLGLLICSDPTVTEHFGREPLDFPGFVRTVIRSIRSA